MKKILATDLKFQNPLCQEFEGFVSFPSRSVLQEKMPKIFKKLYPKTVVIIDAVEFHMQSPSALDLNAACYSSYKGIATMKGLVGISPLGVVSFLSDLSTGSISEKEPTKASGLYKLLSPGYDVISLVVIDQKSLNCSNW